MIVVKYTTPSNKIIYGIMLRRDAESGLIEVAFDQTEMRPFSIGWVNPLKQIGSIILKSNLPVHWRHRALRLIEAKNVEGARELLKQEEEVRNQERIRKERAA